MFPASGWLGELSPVAQKLIETRYPALPVEAISREAGWYVIIREEHKKHPSPKDARKKLQALQKQARQLCTAIEPLAMAPLSGVVREAVAELNFADFAKKLLVFAAAFKEAETRIPEGRRRSPHDLLVSEVAAILLRAGESPNKKPNGTLCQLVGIILTDVKENPSDIPKLVGPVVRRLENSIKQKTKVSREAC